MGARVQKEVEEMKKYEVMYIVRPTLEVDAVKKLIADINMVLTNQQATIVELKEMGLKDLAYEIEHHKKGYYVWLLTEASSEAIKELDRVINITEDIIRHIIVKEGE
jgi:small subunit ribosomal protein S6